MRKIDLLKAMRTFVLVAEKESFSAASRVLNLVTSAVSKQVSDLETHYGAQLLYRTTRTMRLTHEGEYYIQQFKDIIERIDALDAITHVRQDKISGYIRICAPLGSTALGIQQSASNFMKIYPDVRIAWMFANRFVNLIEEGIDLSLRVGALPDSGLVARRYASTKVHFVASPHYIKKNGTPAHPKELVQHRCILDTSNRLPGRWRYREKGTEKQVSVKPFIEANNGEVVAQFATDGHGIAYLPTFLIQPYLDTKQLQPILRDFELAALPVSLVFPANRLMSPTLRTLIQFLLAHKPEVTE